MRRATVRDLIELLEKQPNWDVPVVIDSKHYLSLNGIEISLSKKDWNMDKHEHLLSDREVAVGRGEGPYTRVAWLMI